MVAAAYDFLREMPPYKGWRMPPGDSVIFVIARDANCYGYYQPDGEHHRIGVVDLAVGHTTSLVKVVAHEMIHMHQYLKRLDTRGAVHNANFRKLADRVCRTHGWDPKMFFI